MGATALAYLIARRVVYQVWRRVCNYPPGSVGLVPVASNLAQITGMDSAWLAGQRTQYGAVSMHWIGWKRVVLINSTAAMRRVFIDLALVDRMQVMSEQERAHHEAGLVPLRGSTAFGGSDGATHWWSRRKLMHLSLMRLLDTTHVDRIVADFMESTVFPKMAHGEEWTTQRRDTTRVALNTLYRSGFGFAVNPTDSELDRFMDNVAGAFSTMPLIHLAKKLPSSLAMPVVEWVGGDAVKCAGRNKRMIAAWVEEYKEKKMASEFYVDSLLSAVEEGALSFEEAVADMGSIFLAGSHSTQTTVEQALMHAVRQPAIQEQLHSALCDAFPDPSDVALRPLRSVPLMRAFVLETLRLSETVLTSLSRYVREPIEVDGWTVPSASIVMLNICAISRDPAAFGEDCLRFRPGRWLREDGSLDRSDMDRLVAFGVGKRNCAGRALAEKQVTLILAHLIRRFRFQSDEVVIPVYGFQSFNTVQCPSPLRVFHRDLELTNDEDG